MSEQTRPDGSASGGVRAALQKSPLLQADASAAEPPSRALGLAVVIVIHLVVGYALATGLAQKAIQVIRPPVQASLLQEVKIPEPPPPAPPRPPKQIVKPPPVPLAPPPPFVPPPEFTPPAVPEPPIALRSETPPPAAPAMAPAPAPAAPAKAEIALICPDQKKPDMPSRAIREGISGTVRAELHISGGKVQEVKFLSGPRVFYEAVRSAMLQYRCAVGDGSEVIAIQEFRFELN